MSKKSEELFESKFKDMIKSIIEEEKYFKEENIKVLVDQIIEKLDPIIAKHVKNHFEELCNYFLNKIKEEERTDA